MKKNCGIYKITSPSGRIYIGKSKDIYKRWSDYKALSCEDQIKLYNSFKKYGVENHIFEIVCECEESQLNYLEMYLISYYDSIRKGLNCNMGGKGGLISKESIEKRTKTRLNKNNGQYHSEEGIKKMAEKLSKKFKGRKGKPITKEHKEKLKEINKGKVGYWKDKKLREEHKQKLSQRKINDTELSNRQKQMWANRTEKEKKEIGEKISKSQMGKKILQETKKKISVTIKKLASEKNLKRLKGDEHPMKRSEMKKIISEKSSKKVLQYSLDGRLIKEWSSIKEAEESLNISKVGSVCNQKNFNKTAGGFIWKFKDKIIEPILSKEEIEKHIRIKPTWLKGKKQKNDKCEFCNKIASCQTISRFHNSHCLKNPNINIEEEKALRSKSVKNKKVRENCKK